jgi:hypothetical protein
VDEVILYENTGTHTNISFAKNLPYLIKTPNDNYDLAAQFLRKRR